MPTVDAEVGTALLFPSSAEVDDGGLTAEGLCGGGRLFRAHRTGIFRACVPGTSWAVFVRIARKEFVGLAQYRHLESEEDDGDE